MYSRAVSYVAASSVRLCNDARTINAHAIMLLYAAGRILLLQNAAPVGAKSSGEAEQNLPQRSNAGCV